MKDPVWNSLKIYLVPIPFVHDTTKGQEDTEFYMSSDVINTEEFTLLTTASEICPQVASCGLPAVHLTEQNLCITGLCSVLRFLISNLSPNNQQELLGR